MSGHKISGRIFEIAHLIHCIVIIWGVPSSTWFPPSTFVSKSIRSIINYFSLGIYIFRSLVPPGSRRFISSCWIFFVSGDCAWLLCLGSVILEVPFLVASEKNNSAQVPRFAILRLAISTYMPPFLWFHQLVHIKLGVSHITLRV